MLLLEKLIRKHDEEESISVGTLQRDSQSLLYFLESIFPRRPDSWSVIGRSVFAEREWGKTDRTWLWSGRDEPLWDKL